MLSNFKCSMLVLVSYQATKIKRRLFCFWMIKPKIKSVSFYSPEEYSKESTKLVKKKGWDLRNNAEWFRNKWNRWGHNMAAFKAEIVGSPGLVRECNVKKDAKKHIQHDAHIKDLNTIISSCHIQAKLGFQMKIYRYCHILHSKI